MLDKSQYFFGGYRRFFIMGVWFMTIVSAVTMCNERVRVSENTQETKKVLAKINYQPKPNTYIHFFDNKQGTRNDFYIMKANSTGRYSDSKYFGDKCYKWRLEKLGSGHSSLQSAERNGYVIFGLERGVAYLFVDMYPTNSRECRGISDQKDGVNVSHYGDSGAGISKRQTIRLGPTGFAPVAPKQQPAPRPTYQRQTVQPTYRRDRPYRYKRPSERRRYRRQQRNPVILGPGRTLGNGPSYYQGR